MKWDTYKGLDEKQISYLNYLNSSNINTQVWKSATLGLIIISLLMIALKNILPVLDLLKISIYVISASIITSLLIFVSELIMNLKILFYLKKWRKK